VEPRSRTRTKFKPRNINNSLPSIRSAVDAYRIINSTIRNPDLRARSIDSRKFVVSVVRLYDECLLVCVLSNCTR
jgi:hypothetical protein